MGIKRRAALALQRGGLALVHLAAAAAAPSLMRCAQHRPAMGPSPTCTLLVLLASLFICTGRAAGEAFDFNDVATPGTACGEKAAAEFGTIALSGQGVCEYSVVAASHDGAFTTVASWTISFRGVTAQ